MNILLTGWYGEGNFGDDLLSLVSVALLRQAFPGARIHVLSAGPGEYLRDWLGDVEVLFPGCRGTFDLVFHGGGGTYFDFDPHGWFDRFLNAVIRRVGPSRFVAAENRVRSVLARPRIRARYRIGAGLGVGTFTAGSPRLRDAYHSLLDFDRLMVRDADSSRNLAAIGVPVVPEVVSDLAFLRRCWLPVRARGPEAGATTVNIILRDWPDAGYLAWIESSLPRLAEIAPVRFITLDAGADRGVMARFSNQDVVCWRPGTTNLVEFCRLLADAAVTVTSRAHGAIVSAALGVPAVVLEIEPKLRAVHGMLPTATRLVAGDGLAEAVLELQCRPGAAIEAEVKLHEARLESWLVGAFAGIG